METNQTELVQLIRQLKDYVIIDRKDYESLVRNSTPGGCNESALEVRDEIVRENEIYKGLIDEQKEINKQIKAYNEILKQHNNYLMSFYNISRGL